MKPPPGLDPERRQDSNPKANRKDSAMTEGPNADRERLMKRVSVRDDGCWEWSGSKHVRSGYGNFWLHGRTTSAHRAAYTVLVGPIPDGLELDHLCRNRACVNPAHLEPVTSSQNKLRSPLTGRAWQRAGLAAVLKNRAEAQHCRNGHLRSEHSYINPHGLRICRVCRRATVDRYKASKAVA